MGEELAKALENKVAFTIPVFGGISVNESVVVTWIIMGIIMLLVLLMTRNLKIVPSKPQALLELAVSWVNHFLEGCTGKAGKRYFPYLATVLLYLGFSNLIGLFGFVPPTKDINVTAALAIMSIILIEASTFRAQGGIKGFLKSFAKPMPLLIPINIMELGIRPLSLCMRLFGNVLGAFIVMELIKMVVPAVVPVAFSMYFDVFDGLIQAYVFVFLTALFMSEGLEREEN